MMTAVTGRSELVDRAEHVGGVAVHLHVVPAPDHLAVGPDEIGHPGHPHVRATVEALLLPRSEAIGHLVLGIGQQREVELVLAGELGLARGVQHAHPENGRLAFLEGGQRVAEGAGLLGAAGGVVLRVEVDDQRTARVVLQPMRPALLIWQRERGRPAPGLDERHRNPPGRRWCGAGARPRRALILLPRGRARYRPESRRPIRFSTTWVTAEKSSRP